MRRFVCAGLMAFMALAPGASRAQEEAAPWPPDPGAIFAEGVEVVEVTEGEIQPTFIPPQGVTIYADSDAGVVRIYEEDTSTWIAYPFPESATSFDPRVSVRSDGLLRLDPPGFGGSQDAAAVWLLNPTTGGYSRPEIMCGTVRDAAGEGRWIVSPREPDAPEHRLCFTETGELTDPLPSLTRNSQSVTLYWNAIATNPTKEWVVLGDQGCKETFYAYNIPTNELYPLGVNLVTQAGGIGGNHCYIDTWLDDTFFLMFVYDQPEYSDRIIYAGDVSQPNSLEAVLANNRFWPTYYDDPPRYELVPGMTMEGIGWRGWDRQGPWCRLELYYLETRRLEEYELGELCTPNLVVPQDMNIRFFRYVGLDLTQPATLSSYHLRTRQRTDLFSGEIEAITNVSRDGRYIILLMDDNGRIDAIPDLDWISWTEWGNTYWAVFDTERREIIYQIPDAVNFYDNFEIPTTAWFAEDAFEFVQIHPGGWGEYITWVWIGEARTISLEGVQSREKSPDGNQILVDSSYPIYHDSEETGYVCSISVVNLSNQQLVQVTLELSGCPYGLSAEWVDNNLVNVTVTPASIDSEPTIMLIYTIRLPQPESQ